MGQRYILFRKNTTQKVSKNRKNTTRKNNLNQRLKIQGFIFFTTFAVLNAIRSFKMVRLWA